ncbi:hypothetical protein pb186bvf_019369 [Paramecium bursaria]
MILFFLYDLCQFWIFLYNTSILQLNTIFNAQESLSQEQYYSCTLAYFYCEYEIHKIMSIKLSYLRSLFCSRTIYYQIIYIYLKCRPWKYDIGYMNIVYNQKSLRNRFLIRVVEEINLFKI